MRPRVRISEGAKRLWMIAIVPWSIAVVLWQVSTSSWSDFQQTRYEQWRERDALEKFGVTYAEFQSKNFDECQRWNALVYRCTGRGTFGSQVAPKEANEQECLSVVEAVEKDRKLQEEAAQRSHGIFFDDDKTEPGTRNCSDTFHVTWGPSPPWQHALWGTSYLTKTGIMALFLIGVGAAAAMLFVHGVTIPLCKWVIAGFKHR